MVSELSRSGRGGRGNGEWHAATIIHPRHVHKALRRYLGIEQSPATNRFRINHTEDFAFFG